MEAKALVAEVADIYSRVMSMPLAVEPVGSMEPEFLAILQELREKEKECEMLERKCEQLEKQLEESQKAPCDLTGLYKRKHLKEAYEAILTCNNRRSDEERISITMVVIDIDHFKQVNDTLGHLAGDEVLKQVASALKDSVRDEDVMTRYGGEEFVALLSGIDNEADAHNFVDRIRNSVEKLCQLDEYEKLITISAGVFVDTSGKGSFDKVFEKADKNLYQAKESGRNRVVVSS